MKEEGLITIQTGTSLTGIEILIMDNGPGIPESQLKTIFQPGVTTKHNRHSGLGLSITQKILTDMKGTITCKSSDKGTTFSISLKTATT